MTVDEHVAQIRLDVAELTRPRGLLELLAALLPEPVADPTQGTSSHHKVTGSPAPWHVEAAGVLMDVHVGAREVEDQLRAALGFTRLHEGQAEVHPRCGPSGEHGPFRPVRVVAGEPGGRGGSLANTARALHAIPDLAAAAGDPHAGLAARQVARWCQSAKEVRDIDEAERWVPVPRPRGGKPPACPYCGTYALRMRPRVGDVHCTNLACTAPATGERPVARVVTGRVSGLPALVFPDGTEVAAPGVGEEPAELPGWRTGLRPQPGGPAGVPAVLRGSLATDDRPWGVA